jgi:predicted AlkP superfamily pyrophosphatase or phosphodiesterase
MRPDYAGRMGARLVSFLILLLLTRPAWAAEPAPLIVISIDGFRADYIDRGVTPTLARLAKDGAHATAMRPSFPSVTYPNHYTLVTGLYPDHHGVVDNNMWDAKVSPERFTVRGQNTELPAWWEGATPLWNSAQAQGRISAAAGWPGSSVKIDGGRPDYLDNYRPDRDPQEIAAVSLNWLDLPAKFRPALQFLYFDDVDRAGHEHGPDSPDMNQALRRVDAALASLVAGLKKRGLYGRTNIVIVSDHGMAATANARATVIDELAGPDIASIRSNPAASVGIDALPGKEAELAAILLAPHPHFTCWRKGEIPARFHYGSNPRVPQFFCLNETGWGFTTKAAKAGWTKEHPGDHGFDPADPAMAALFVAHGPAFRSGVTLNPFDNVNVYALLAQVGGVAPQSHDGSLAPFEKSLK